MRKIRAFILFLILFASLTYSIPLSTCQEINSSGSYELQEDISANASPCFTIKADDVVLDCQRNTLSGEIVLRAEGKNFVVKDCKIEGKVEILGSGAKILDSEFENSYLNSSAGIFLESSSFYSSRADVIGNVEIYSSSFSDSEINLFSSSFQINSSRFSKGNTCLYADEKSKGYVDRSEFEECETGSKIMGEGKISRSSFSSNGVGLVIDSNSEVYSNVFEDNGLALNIIGSGNLIYDNKFERNDEDVRVSNEDNDFYVDKDCRRKNILGGKCMGGNYWDKYSGYDEDGDGFGEEPYKIAENIFDELPLTQFFDKYPPSLYLDSPKDGAIINTSTIEIVYRAFDDLGLARCYVVLDGKETPIKLCKKHYSLENVGDGEHKLGIKVVDLVGKTAEKVITIYVDTTPPEITIHSPKEGEHYSSTIPVYLSVEDSGEVFCFYSLDGGEEREFDCRDFDIVINKSGEHTIKIKAVDKAGNVNEKTISFFGSAEKPRLSLSYSLKCPGNKLVVDVYGQGKKVDEAYVELKRRPHPGKLISLGKRAYMGKSVEFYITEEGDYVLSASKEGYEDYEELISLQLCKQEKGGGGYIAPPPKEKEKKGGICFVILPFLLVGGMYAKG